MYELRDDLDMELEGCRDYRRYRGYRVEAYMNALINKLSKEKSNPQKMQTHHASQDLGAVDRAVPSALDEGETSLHSEKVQQIQGADVSAEVVEDIYGATPTQGSTEISDAGVEECVISEDEAKEELNHILRLCHDQYRNDPVGATFLYYFVNGNLMNNVRGTKGRAKLARRKGQSKLGGRSTLT